MTAAHDRDDLLAWWDEVRAAMAAMIRERKRTAATEAEFEILCAWSDALRDELSRLNRTRRPGE